MEWNAEILENRLESTVQTNIVCYNFDLRMHWKIISASMIKPIHPEKKPRVAPRNIAAQAHAPNFRSMTNTCHQSLEKTSCDGDGVVLGQREGRHLLLEARYLRHRPARDHRQHPHSYLER